VVAAVLAGHAGVQVRGHGEAGVHPGFQDVALVGRRLVGVRDGVGRLLLVGAGVAVAGAVWPAAGRPSRCCRAPLQARLLGGVKMGNSWGALFRDLRAFSIVTVCQY
jgi:hypothetical protein